MDLSNAITYINNYKYIYISPIISHLDLSHVCLKHRHFGVRGKAKLDERDSFELQREVTGAHRCPGGSWSLHPAGAGRGAMSRYTCYDIYIYA